MSRGDNMGASSKSEIISVDNELEMSTYDSLPPEARYALAYADIRWSATEIAQILHNDNLPLSTALRALEHAEQREKDHERSVQSLMNIPHFLDF